MGRLRTAVVECKYKDIQLKEQFIHGLKDDEMLAEVIKELNKGGEDATIPSETVLAWAIRVGTERVQTAVISSFCKSRNFDAITHKENRLGTNSMQVTQSSPKGDKSTGDKSINQDDAQHMVKGVTRVAGSSTLRQFVEGPRPVWSTQLREKTFMSKNGH